MAENMTTISSSVVPPTSKSNKELTPEERQTKATLKRQLKLKSRWRKYSVRLAQAQQRGDAALVEQTRRDLASLEKECNEFDEQLSLEPAKLPIDEDGIPAIRDLIERIYLNWQQRLASGAAFCGTKEDRHADSRILLNHMSQGTTDPTMFANTGALYGYARQKFFQRAVLIAQSLSRCRTTKLPTNVDSICSIGCGPGCDFVGALAFYHSNKDETECSPRPLRHAILLDWAMSHWRALCEPLGDLLRDENLIKELLMGRCNACKNLDSNTDENSEALGFLSRKVTVGRDGDQSPSFFDTDLYVVSYLLSETRGQWISFFDTLVDHAKSGAVFILTDPTPWQIHQFKARYEMLFEYEWVDSSQDEPAMQPLMNRFGPAALVAKKLPR